MDTTHPSRTRWRKPARSGSNGNCIEITATGTIIAARDPHGPRLAFTPGWRAFTTAIRAQQR